MVKTLITSEVDFDLQGKQAGVRTSPLDEGNLNRTFPGDPRGTPTEMIVHYIEEVLMPNTKYAFDLHSGDTALVYPPTLLRGRGHTPDPVSSPVEGMVLCKQAPGQVERGDAVFQIAADADAS